MSTAYRNRQTIRDYTEEQANVDANLQRFVVWVLGQAIEQNNMQRAVEQMENWCALGIFFISAFPISLTIIRIMLRAKTSAMRDQETCNIDNADVSFLGEDHLTGYCSELLDEQL